MGWSKKKLGRVIDMQLVRKVRQMPCAVCEWPHGCDAHHLQTRGAGGPDTLSNLISLCRHHHTEVHAMGIKSFAARYELPITWDSGYPRRSDVYLEAEKE